MFAKHKVAVVSMVHTEDGVVPGSVTHADRMVAASVLILAAVAAAWAADNVATVIAAAVMAAKITATMAIVTESAESTAAVQALDVTVGAAAMRNGNWRHH